MKVLHSETYEREGNDAWLIDKIQIIQEDGELILRHKVNHKGWNGDIKHIIEIDLDEFDTIEDQQTRIQEYMDDKFLTPNMKVPILNEILNER